MNEAGSAAIIALAAVAALVILSSRANSRHRHLDRLPMQWSISDSVNWTAPRVLALSFMPVLGGTTLALAVLCTLLLDPRPGQEGFEVPGVALMALTLIAIHALHLWLIARNQR